MPASTEKLVLKAQSGDKQAFIELMEASKLSLTRAAMSILHNDEDVADAVAETVLEAHLEDLPAVVVAKDLSTGDTLLEQELEWNQPSYSDPNIIRPEVEDDIGDESQQDAVSSQAE